MENKIWPGELIKPFPFKPIFKNNIDIINTEFSNYIVRPFLSI